MTRKQLEELGLTKEQADKVIEINGDDIENAKTDLKSTVKTLEKDKEELQKQITDRDSQLETLKKSAGDNESLSQQIAELQAANQTAKESYEAQMNQLKIDFAVEKALTGAKAKNIKAVTALLDLKDAKLDEDGSVKGLSEQIEKLSKAEDSKFLFDTAPAQPKLKGFQPGASSDIKPDAGGDMSKMTYSEMVAYLAENPGATI